MTSIIHKLSRLFGRSGEPESTASAPEPKPPVSTPTTPPAEESPTGTEDFSKPPAVRRVIQAPDITPDVREVRNSDRIIIKAQPSASGDQCKFMVNRPLFRGHSWYFPTFESASGSPLAEAVFSREEVESLLVHGATAVVTKAGSRSMKEWERLARELGPLIRGALESGRDLIAPEIVQGIPEESEVRAEIQKVIDTEVNPGVAGHGGRITLTRVEGNSVTIQMGGGCQGCSAADMTLKQGIHNAFRKAAPFVGAIYDETDHAAGVNPYFS